MLCGGREERKIGDEARGDVSSLLVDFWPLSDHFAPAVFLPDNASRAGDGSGVAVLVL